MGRFDEEGPVPVPFETKVRYSRTRQQELREAADHVRETTGAARKRRRWWPFGKRREK